MKNMIISGVLILVVTMGFIFYYVGGMIGDDMVNILSIIAAVIILAASIGITLKYINQIKNDKSTGELKGEVWDDTIQEYNNSLPIGWSLSFIASIRIICLSKATCIAISSIKIIRGDISRFSNVEKDFITFLSPLLHSRWDIVSNGFLTVKNKT